VFNGESVDVCEAREDQDLNGHVTQDEEDGERVFNSEAALVAEANRVERVLPEFPDVGGGEQTHESQVENHCVDALNEVEAFQSELVLRCPFDFRPAEALFEVTLHFLVILIFKRFNVLALLRALVRACDLDEPSDGEADHVNREEGHVFQ